MHHSASRENALINSRSRSSFSPVARVNSTLNQSYNLSDNNIDNSLLSTENSSKPLRSLSATSLFSNSNFEDYFPELLEMEDDNANIDYLDDGLISPFPTSNLLHKQKSLYDRPSTVFTKSSSSSLLNSCSNNRPHTVDSKYLVASAPQMMERALSKSQSYGFGPKISTPVATLKKPVRIGLSKSASSSSILDTKVKNVVENLAKIQVVQNQVEKEEVSRTRSSLKEDSTNALLLGNPADLIKFDYVPPVVFTPAENAAEMAEKGKFTILK